MLMAENFHAPAEVMQVLGEQKDLQGRLARTTLLLLDSDRHLFCLTVETAENYEARIVEEVSSGEVSEGLEPVFVVPAESIDTETLDEVVTMPAELLAKFLVEQNVEIDL
jgi:hypothetical protein